MKPLFTALLLMATVAGFSQDTSRTFNLKQVGWTIALPAGFRELTRSEDAVNTERGKKLLEKASGAEIDASGTITLFSAVKNTHNYLTANVTAFDPKTDGSYDENLSQVKELLFITFKENMPDAILDSATTATTIDGLKFDKYRISVIVNQKKIFSSYLLSKLYMGYDFGISYLCLDDKTLRDVEDALNRSKFKK